MQIQNINNKLIINPKTIEHIDNLEYVNQLKEYKDIIVDMMDELPHSSIIGKLRQLQENGKKIFIMVKDGCIISDLLVGFNVVEI